MIRSLDNIRKMCLKLKLLNRLLYVLVLLNAVLLAKTQLLSGISVVLGQKHYYIENSNEANFYQAAQICKQLGMSLASIEKETEYKNLKSILLQNNLLENTFWLSGTKSGTDEVWYWLGTGKRITYTNPNAPTGSGPCLSTTTTDFEYTYAVTCDTETLYICEKPLMPSCGKYGQCRYRYIANTN